jgi:hypothetical protein
MSSTTEAPLASWRDTAARRAILEFVAAATREGDEGWIPSPERVVGSGFGTAFADGEVVYTDDRGGADKVLGAGFTEISMRDGWATVFAD